MDTMRGMPNNGTSYTTPTTLMAHESSAEAAYDVAWATATGFYLHNGVADGKYIYMAIRRPNKPAEEFEAEELFHVDTTLADRAPTCRTPFVADMGFSTTPSSNSDNSIGSRLTQGGFLKTHETSAEQASSPWQWDHMDGWLDFLSSNSTHWSWRRAPGFFDVVAYEGSGQAGREVPHSLGVVPEMMWIKRRTGSYNWGVWHKDVSSPSPHYELVLNKADKVTDDNNTNTPFYAVPTSNDFFLTAGTLGNKTGDDYIAHLFASVPGICDIGSFTDTGAEENIDCGFTNGARFVLIKPTNNSGDWSLFDTTRGITDTSSPRLALNTTGGSQNTTAIKPFTGGFRIALNTSGWEYIYMAIA